jgi:hypothetical protein
MKAFQERVVQEKKELDKKIESLTEFLKDPAIKCAVELDRLDTQLAIMQSYSAILKERIEHFT